MTQGSAAASVTFFSQGVVFLNKAFHDRTVQVLFDLNKNHAQTYRWIWGG